MLDGTRIVLGVSGGIAARTAPELLTSCLLQGTPSAGSSYSQHYLLLTTLLRMTLGTFSSLSLLHNDCTIIFMFMLIIHCPCSRTPQLRSAQLISVSNHIYSLLLSPLSSLTPSHPSPLPIKAPPNHHPPHLARPRPYLIQLRIPECPSRRHFVHVAHSTHELYGVEGAFGGALGRVENGAGAVLG